MALVKGRDTGPELVVRSLVAAIRRGYRLHPRSIVGRPDIAFIGAKLAIFVNGCFWHRHACSLGRVPKSRVPFWTAKLDANRRRDRRVNRELRGAGWAVLTIWECQLREHEKLTRRLRAFLHA